MKKRQIYKSLFLLLLHINHIMPVAIAEKHIVRKLTVNLDQHQINVRPIIKGIHCNLVF